MWLFLVQHHFEAAYWRRDRDWDHVEAALEGSSHYALPWPLGWFTADIGLHHLHHLDSQIPNYRLRECARAHPELRAARRLSLRESLACVSFALWDEGQGRMVRFRNLGRTSSNSCQPTVAVPGLVPTGESIHACGNG
jgi:omega-6 fatty acid desaturase (delta-12 desaturase)